jgi:hypothetical protein
MRRQGGAGVPPVMAEAKREKAMQDVQRQAPAPPESHFGPGGRALFAIAKIFAVAGGLIFVGLVVMEIVSIVGRKLFLWAVPGDVEVL